MPRWAGEGEGVAAGGGQGVKSATGLSIIDSSIDAAIVGRSHARVNLVAFRAFGPILVVPAFALTSFPLMAVSATGFSAGSVTALSGAQSDRVSAALRRPAERLAQEAESTREAVGIRAGAVGDGCCPDGIPRCRMPARYPLPLMPGERQKPSRRHSMQNVLRWQAPRATGQWCRCRAGRRARQHCASQLERVVADNATAFRDAGIRVQQDGSLTVDAKAWNRLMQRIRVQSPRRSVQCRTRRRGDCDRQLGSNGSIGAAVNNLNTRLQQLETRQENVRVRADESQRAVETSARRYGLVPSVPVPISVSSASSFSLRS